MDKKLENDAINCIRFLSADMVQKANSGHPGLPMGAAALAYTLWTRFLRHNPRDPKWPDRDRFVLSGGHGSALLYSLLHLTGYDLPLEELQSFRQWGSRAPGHPEWGHTSGVEVTTGPLGQGFGNGVGMAIAEAHLAEEFNRPGHELIHHRVFAIVTDGDLMEGVASEAASLAGHLQLGHLIYLYDDNHISIDGSTDLAFTEDRLERFTAYGWHTQQVTDGNDVEAVDAAIRAAIADPRPSLIACRTHIGYGLPHRQDTNKAHGEAPGVEELRLAKENLGWPVEPSFLIPKDVLAVFRQSVDRGHEWQIEWEKQLEDYRRAFPDLAGELERRLKGELPSGWGDNLPVFTVDTKGLSTRAASGKTLNALAGRLPELLGGSADLTPSNDTWLDGQLEFQKNSPQGRNFHFGVREHGMGSIINGMAVHGGLIPYGGTFLVFSDYMRGALRLSALSQYPSIWVFTHDSIGLGEDGPTHQPVEHLAALRAMPGMMVIRPGDANETVEAWKVAISRRHGPTALALTRQAVPTLDRSIFTPAAELQRGAYVLADIGDEPPELILMASGSELHLIVDAGLRLGAEGINVRIVSFPSWELFTAQDPEYQQSVFPASVHKRLAVEAGVPMGWERWVGDGGAILGLDHYGASAPGQVVFEHFGFTVDAVFDRARRLLREVE